MLNSLTLQRVKEIESQQKEIDITFGDDALFHLGYELPSADKLKANKCKPIQKVSVNELLEQDPFNFKGLFYNEYINLSKKQNRFKESKSFTSKLAGVATLSGELNHAENILQEAINTKPDIHLLHKLGDTLILQGKDEKAISTFEQSDLSSDLYSNLRIAYIHTKSNNLNSAMKYLENAQKIDPRDFRHQMFMGAIHLNSGHCEQAIRNFRVASETKKDSSALHVNLAASHWSLGHTEKTVKELKKAITINPLNENALIFYADIMFTIKKNDKVIPSLEFYVKLNQKSKFAWERLARAYYFTGKFSKAMHALENQISLIDEPFAYNNLGLVCWQLKEEKVAIKYLYKSIQDSKADNRKMSVPLLNLAMVLNERKRHKECHDLLKSYIECDNKDVDDRILCKIYIEYLSALDGLDKFEEATNKLNEFVNKQIGDVEGKTLLLICKTYSDAVINNDAEECLKTSYILLPLLKNNIKELSDETIRLAYNNLAFNALLLNNISEARIYLDKITKYINTEPYCTATYGLYNIKKGFVEQGIKYYETAISLAKIRDVKDKIRQRMNFELGKYFADIGNNNDSIRYFNKVVKETNGHKFVTKQAVEMLKRIQS